MKLDLNDIKKMDSKQIYNSLLPIINELYLSFEYANISSEDYEKLVLNEISNSKKTYKGNKDYIDYIKRKIKLQLSEIINKKLANSKNSFTLLNNYINKKFGNVSNYKDAIQNFKKLSDFLGTYNYIPNLDLLINLINENVNFKKMITIVFNEYHDQIISGKAEEIFYDSLLLSVIDAYCMLNNIEIDDIENINEDYDLSSLSYTDITTAYLNEIKKIPVLSKEEERKLFIKINEGDSEAKELFIKSNLKLVVSIAKKYIDRGLPLLDLIQEGNIGLLSAIDKYDVNKGFKFSTYANYWIRERIIRSITTKGRNIRIPVYVHEKIKLYRKAEIKLESQLSRSPSIEEIAKELDLPVSDVSMLYNLQVDTLSLNTPIGEDEESELEDFIPSNFDTPEETFMNDNLQSQVKILFEKCKLKPNEIDILMLRYGFNGRQPMTLEEIGKKYNVGRERIRQIEYIAVNKIRRSEYIKELAVYMNNPEQSLKNIKKFREEKYKELKNSFRKDLDEDKKNEKNINKEMFKLKSIYKYFKDYSKEQVDEIITKLTDEEQKLLKRFYKDNLNNQLSATLTIEEIDKFYNILSKIKNLLSKEETISQKIKQKKI